MVITEVRIKLVSGSNDKLRAFCSITIDHDFVIRDLKIIEGAKGPFVAMPSRKLTQRCPSCGGKNPYRARYCNDCGKGLPAERLDSEASQRMKVHADIAHPINSRCRELMQKQVLDQYALELERAKDPNYKPVDIDAFDEEDLGAHTVGEPWESGPGALVRAYDGGSRGEGPREGPSRDLPDSRSSSDPEMVDSADETAWSSSSSPARFPGREVGPPRAPFQGRGAHPRERSGRGAPRGRGASEDVRDRAGGSGSGGYTGGAGGDSWSGPGREPRSGDVGSTPRPYGQGRARPDSSQPPGRRDREVSRDRWGPSRVPPGQPSSGDEGRFRQGDPAPGPRREERGASDAVRFSSEPEREKRRVPEEVETEPEDNFGAGLFS